ncbi:MAG: SMI1/KNR4 family protein [Proteobacteria bacterium]|nr:SMI1/KNR4 family protein [Pseudomonadota bacterium]
MKDKMISVLDAKFEKCPVLVAGAANAGRISELEDFAGFRLPAAYKEFVERYGGAIVGPYSVFGWGASEAMGSNEDSAIAVTNRFRADLWPGSENNLVVSMDHAGNAIMLDEMGTISRFDHDSGDTEILAPGFEHFILDWCFKDYGITVTARLRDYGDSAHN